MFNLSTCKLTGLPTKVAEILQNYVISYRITEIVFKYERMPWLWVKPIFYLLGYARRYYRCLDILQGFTRRVRCFTRPM